MLVGLMVGVAFAGAATLGGLRPVGLLAGAIVLSTAFVLAWRDSRWLGPYVAGVWIFAPLLRRLVDWQAGGYTSLTVLSLLPMLATLTLLVPTLPRLRYLPRRLRLPLALMVVPIVVAGVIGFVRYGVAAAPETAGWLTPMLFVPYFATRAMTEAERWWVLRWVVGLATVSAAYAWYQFLFLPPWDALWLVESGMTSSMGQPEPLKIRAWGTINSVGPAASVWALALIAAFADRRWMSWLRAACLIVLCGALLISIVRIGWIMAVAGMVTYVLLAGGKHRWRTAALFIFMGVATLLIVPLLPGGDRVVDRAATFGNLAEDNSARARLSITGELVSSITQNPLGAGLGAAASDKVAGDGRSVTGIDNGYLGLFVTLSVPGALCWFLGNALFALLLCRGKPMPLPASNEEPSIHRVAVAVWAALATHMLAFFAFAGIIVIPFWIVAGMASAARPGR